MKHSNHYRLLLLQRILLNETDENHELDIYEIERKLKKELNVDKIDHRTLKNDLRALEEMDVEIVRNRRKFGKIYYSQQRKTFETYQLRMLVDAILSARFITPKEKKRLIDKLKQLTSVHIRKSLPHPVVFSQTVNLDYELIKLNVDRLHRAITEQRTVSYQYGEFNVKKEFCFHRNGHAYIVEPYALIWQNDLYYLIGKYRETGEIQHFRLDRMRNITVLDESFQKEKGFELRSYVDNMFHLHGGEEIEVEIRFHISLLNEIFDRFGMDVHIEEDGEEHFIVKTKAKLSDSLVSWILKWGHRAIVIGSDTLRERVETEVHTMIKSYNEGSN